MGHALVVEGDAAACGDVLRQELRSRLHRVRLAAVEGVLRDPQLVLGRECLRVGVAAAARDPGAEQGQHGESAEAPAARPDHCQRAHRRNSRAVACSSWETAIQ